MQKLAAKGGEKREQTKISERGANEENEDTDKENEIA